MQVAAPASAARKVVITGGGWGHGLGLSQWGAYGRALNGDTAEQILRHYYTGVDVRTVNLPSSVRVGLLQARSSISFGARPVTEDGGRVAFRVPGVRESIATGGGGASWRVEPVASGGVRLFKDGRQVINDGVGVFANSKPLRVVYSKFRTAVRVVEKDNFYKHGFLEIDTYSGACTGGRCLRLVAEVPLEEYVLGIAEVPPHWPTESLKTQAIIARTYAAYEIVNNGQHQSYCNCAVYDSSYDQVYVGDDRRVEAGTYWPQWKKAVLATAEIGVLYNGSPIQAFYMSSSGGHTENNEDVWGGTPVPYLRGVPDRADAVAANPNHSWRVSMSWSDFSSRLNAYFSTGSLQSFKLLAPFGASGRVTPVLGPDSGGARIVGSARTYRASGLQIKSALGLKDTLFRVDITR